MYQEKQEPEICGVDLVPEEPGHYICTEFKGRFPHHTCGLHHGENITCDEAEMVYGIDEDLRRYAQ